VATYNESYAGCKIIEIFEDGYLEQLKDFLSRKNPTLYALLLARSSVNQQNAAQELQKCEELLETAVKDS